MKQRDDLSLPPLNRRAFLLRAAAGAGAATAGATVLSVLARSANAAPSSHAAMHSARGVSKAGMSNSDMDIPGMDMPGMRSSNALQNPSQQPGANGGVVDMEGDYYKPTRRAPKANAKPQLTDEQIKDFERTIACPCPCTLDVYTCRTTDFACGNSPAVHRDVQALVAGGYSADEIMQALLGTYGNAILMAPPKSGKNLIAWFAPFAALGAGAIVVSAMLRTWRRNAQTAAATAAANASMRMPDVGATEDEMARLRAALRDDRRS